MFGVYIGVAYLWNNGFFVIVFTQGCFHFIDDNHAV